MSARGIITGCDQNQEWLLPWWWHHYSKHNDYPVAFADFGMSPTALAWCREKGVVYTPTTTVAAKTSTHQPSWRKNYKESIHYSRGCWLKKPFACLETPFEHCVWIDLDCEVRADLDPLFNMLHLGMEIGAVQDPEPRECLKPKEYAYFTGVLAFRKSSAILQHWVQITDLYEHELPSDEEMLSRAIHLFKPKLVALSRFYNWFYNYDIDGPNHPEAKIVHYAGIRGKFLIQEKLRKNQW